MNILLNTFDRIHPEMHGYTCTQSSAACCCCSVTGRHSSTHRHHVCSHDGANTAAQCHQKSGRQVRTENAHSRDDQRRCRPAASIGHAALLSSHACQCPCDCWCLTLCAIVPTRSYEKRKQAAMEIEHIIKEANSSAQKQPQQIQTLIQLLSREYAVPTTSTSTLAGKGRGGAWPCNRCSGSWRSLMWRSLIDCVLPVPVPVAVSALFVSPSTRRRAITARVVLSDSLPRPSHSWR